MKVRGRNHSKIGRILDLSRVTAETENVHAACCYGSTIYKHKQKETDIRILLVIPNYSQEFLTFTKKINDHKLLILAIDRDAFEDDIKSGRFGGFVADIFALPYLPLINKKYLIEMEVMMKKRFIVEQLNNIVLQYPELSLELLIKPEYFMYEYLRRRAKIVPSLRADIIEALSENSKKKNIEEIMPGYLAALRELRNRQYVKFSNGYLEINKDFVEKSKRGKSRLVNVQMSIKRALLPYMRNLSSRFTNAQIFLKENILEFTKFEKNLIAELEESEKYLLMPTKLGLVPMSEKTNIKEFLKRHTLKKGREIDIKFENIGGVLNRVFLIHLQENDEKHNIVVKKFEDWTGFKWLPLALWTLGTQSFAVLGSARLEKEYSINTYLSKQGFTVPQILHVNLKDRFIIEDFVEGETLNYIIKRIVYGSPQHKYDKDYSVLRTVGKEIAQVHAHNVSLGDAKPENILITKKEEICFLDLEQASRNGNPSWDIAEFLYYSGHYFPPIHSDEKVKKITLAFLEGYLEGEGRKEDVYRVASPKYTKVFSVFTLPNIIIAIAKICRRIGKNTI